MLTMLAKWGQLSLEQSSSENRAISDDNNYANVLVYLLCMKQVVFELLVFA